MAYYDAGCAPVLLHPGQPHLAGIPNFRVLTVTTSDERRQRLVAACRTLGSGRRLFLFADQQAPDGGDILAHRWVDGSGLESVRLLP